MAEESKSPPPSSPLDIKQPRSSREKVCRVWQSFKNKIAPDKEEKRKEKERAIDDQPAYPHIPHKLPNFALLSDSDSDHGRRILAKDSVDVTPTPAADLTDRSNDQTNCSVFAGTSFVTTSKFAGPIRPPSPDIIARGKPFYRSNPVTEHHRQARVFPNLAWNENTLEFVRPVSGESTMMPWSNDELNFVGPSQQFESSEQGVSKNGCDAGTANNDLKDTAIEAVASDLWVHGQLVDTLDVSAPAEEIQSVISKGKGKAPVLNRKSALTEALQREKACQTSAEGNSSAVEEAVQGGEANQTPVENNSSSLGREEDDENIHMIPDVLLPQNAIGRRRKSDCDLPKINPSEPVAVNYNAAGVQIMNEAEAQAMNLAPNQMDAGYARKPQFLTLTRDTYFWLPMDLLIRSPYWDVAKMMAKGCLELPNEDPHIVATAMDIINSSRGLVGTEDGLTIVKLLSVGRRLIRWGMCEDLPKMAATIRRYIVRRVFFFNPWEPASADALTHASYVFRSEELYGAWLILLCCPILRTYISMEEIVKLYLIMIPSDHWPSVALETNLSPAFVEKLNTNPIADNPENHFHNQWLYHVEMSGSVETFWGEGSPYKSALLFTRGDPEAQVDATEEEATQPETVTSSDDFVIRYPDGQEVRMTRENPLEGFEDFINIDADILSELNGQPEPQAQAPAFIIDVPMSFIEHPGSFPAHN